MSAYYNEIDPQKAAWLRELISRDLIAPGDVDERSIHDVRPDDLAGYTQCHFFAGIGIWSYALRLAGWEDEREVWTGSCPCQPFSDAGKKEAFDDARHLWPVWFPLIRARRPLVCFGEQVASADGLAWFDVVYADLDNADYACGAVDLCAAGVGAPHRRQRLYWVADAAEARRAGSGFGGPHRQTQDDARLLESSGRSASGESAVSESARSQARISVGVQRGENGRTPAGSEQTGPTLDVAHAASRGCGEFGDAALAGSRGHNSTSEAVELDGRGEVGRMDDSVCIGRGQSRPDHRGDERVVVAADGAHGAVAESSGAVGYSARDDYAALARFLADRAAAQLGGFWRRADLVYCRDRSGPKWRPIGPGAFPLAHGTPARLGRLRGYGDGIVAQVAEAFVRAYMEAVNHITPSGDTSSDAARLLSDSPRRGAFITPASDAL